jgi:bifunctional non-homologous end joining protein LigD
VSRRSSRQPLPTVIEPMLATSGTLPPPGAPFSTEFKWDGMRALVFLDRGHLRVQSRNLKDFTAHYPELQALADATKRQRLVLDGELICVGDDGRPCFETLQTRIRRSARHGHAARAAAAPATYMIFDVLYADGYSVIAEPYRVRRNPLEGLTLTGPSWQTPAAYTGDPAKIQVVSREHGLEGVVCKRLDSVYVPGKPSREWVKVKNVQRGKFVIGGWIDAGDGSIEALLVGESSLPRGKPAPSARTRPRTTLTPSAVPSALLLCDRRAQ